MRRFALAAALVAAAAGEVGANGRPAAVVSLRWQQGHEQNIVAGVTFGDLVSHDAGATWQWMCEKPIGYGGMFDPVYAYSQTGAIFATTFGGLKVNRDGCTYNAAPPGMTFISTIALGPDHAFYYGAADLTDSSICKSIDDGMTFPTCISPGVTGTSWKSIVVSPVDAQRVYVSGYFFHMVCNASSSNAGATCTMDNQCTGTGAKCETQKALSLFKSIDGGASYTAMTTTGLTFQPNSLVDLYPDPSAVGTLYARITLELNGQGDGVFKTTNSGASWTKIFEKNEGVSFVPRSNGQLVAGTQSSGSFVSANGGTTWTPLVNPPHISCLYENAAKEVWACTQNYGMPGVDSDGYGLMKTTDLATWTGVLHFQDIAGPVQCAPTTVQAQQCIAPYQPPGGMLMPSIWCCLVQQLGITSTAVDCSAPDYQCNLTLVDGPIDASDTTHVTRPKGCCDTGDDGLPGFVVLAFGIGIILMRRRREM